MLLLADENFPGPVVRTLRSLGHDIAHAKETMRSAPDHAVLRAAQAEGRVLLTCDKDFGELAFAARLPSQCGVILFRLGGSSPSQDNDRMVRVLTGRDDWAGNVAVGTDARVRLRPIPRHPGATETGRKRG